MDKSLSKQIKATHPETEFIEIEQDDFRVKPELFEYVPAGQVMQELAANGVHLAQFTCMREKKQNTQ